MTISDDQLGTIYQVIALAGVVAAFLGWRGRRPEAARWCPRCGQDLSDTESRTCTGCGYSSPRERDFHQRRRVWWVLIAGLSIVATASGLAVATGVASGNRMIGPAWSLAESRSLPNGWSVDHEFSEDPARTIFARRIRVRRGGVTHFVWNGWSSRLGFVDSNTGRSEGLGTDIDRNGEPDLVVQVSDGGNTSPLTWFVISLADRSGGARLEPAAVLRDGRFEDVDGDGRWEFIAHDSGLRDVWARYRALDVPSVVLSPSARGWSFDRGTTESRAMPDGLDGEPSKVLASAHEAWRASRTPFVSRLFSTALHLVARGRAEEALALVRSPWPGDDAPGSVSEFETVVDERTGLPLRYEPTSDAREKVLRDLLARWRWGDRWVVPGR